MCLLRLFVCGDWGVLVGGYEWFVNVNSKI